jgi:hypothetical protein
VGDCQEMLSICTCPASAASVHESSVSFCHLVVCQVLVGSAPGTVAPVTRYDTCAADEAGIDRFVRWRVQLMERAIAMCDWEAGVEKVLQVGP